MFLFFFNDIIAFKHTNNVDFFLADIKCLQNVLKDEKSSLQPDCYKMLTTRIEMFRNAEKVNIKISSFFTYFVIFN